MFFPFRARNALSLPPWQGPPEAREREREIETRAPRSACLPGKGRRRQERETLATRAACLPGKGRRRQERERESLPVLFFNFFKRKPPKPTPQFAFLA